MFRYLVLAAFIAIFSTSSLAHQAFTLVSSEKLTVTQAQLDELQKQASVGKAVGADLTFTGSDLKLVFTAGPEDDMLSYRVQGVRNPNIITQGDIRMTVWFVNTDDDMPHDLLFSHYMADFADAPDVALSAGTQRVRAHESEAAPFNAEKIVIRSNEDGAYRYFCSVRGHAKGGMWGNILVGVKPGANMQMPAKPAGGKMDDMPGMKMPAARPTPTPQDMSPMPGMSMSPKAMPTPSENADPLVTSRQIQSIPTMTMHMGSVTNIGDPMSREPSGTAWNPDSSPVFCRYEIVKKDGRDLVLPAPLLNGEYWLNVFKVGYIRDIVQGKGVDVGLGGMFTLDHNPQSLASTYGGTTHGGWQAFMRFRASEMK